MAIDIVEVKKYIKPKADSTLRNMRKDDLIEYIRCLEHNYNVAVSFNENQARYIESLDVVEVTRCKECKYQYTGSMGTRFCQIWDKPNGYGDEGYCCYGERKKGAD